MSREKGMVCCLRVWCEQWEDIEESLLPALTRERSGWRSSYYIETGAYLQGRNLRLDLCICVCICTCVCLHMRVFVVIHTNGSAWGAQTRVFSSSVAHSLSLVTVSHRSHCLCETGWHGALKLTHALLLLCDWWAF